MKQINIKNSQNEITNCGKFSSNELCLAWYNQENSNGSFLQNNTYEIIDITAQLSAQQESEDAKKYLASTDWKILRHLRQKALNLPSSLTELEYLDLENSRHAAAAKVIHE